MVTTIEPYDHPAIFFVRILFTITYFTPYVSGLTLCVTRLAEAIAGRGHTVTVLTMKHESKLRPQETIRAVRIVRAAPIARLSKGFLSFAWLRHAWREARDHDVIIVNLPQMEGFLPALFGKLFGKRIVAIYHCEVILPDSFFNQIVQSFLEISNSVTLLFADRVVTYTRDFARHSRILVPYLRKAVYIYPPVPAPKSSPSVQKRLRAKIGKADVVIGVAARLAAEKGIEYLFEAIPLLKLKMKNVNFKIAVAGPMEPVGEVEYRKKIRTLVERYKRHIVFLGTIKPGEMGGFYSLLDVLVLPSVNSTEAFGMVQVEAMMMGVPVVVSDLPGVRVPIQKTGMGILVPPRNSAALSDAIVRIIKDPDGFRLHHNDTARIFQFERTVEAYEGLFT